MNTDIPKSTPTQINSLNNFITFWSRLFYLLSGSLHQFLPYSPNCMQLKLYLSHPRSHLAFPHQAPFTQSRKWLIHVDPHILTLTIPLTISLGQIFIILFMNYCSCITILSLGKIYCFLYPSYTPLSDFFF